MTPGGQDLDAVDIGRRVIDARAQKGWSQSELADAADVSRSTVQKVEAGKSVERRNLFRVMRATGLDHAPPPEPALGDDLSPEELLIQMARRLDPTLHVYRVETPDGPNIVLSRKPLTPDQQRRNVELATTDSDDQDGR